MGALGNAGRAWRLAGFLYLIIMLAALSLPALVAVITSLKTPQEIYTTPPTWFPHQPRPANYVDMFRVLPLARAFLNSAIVAGGSALLALGAALPAAYALSRHRFRGRRVYLFLILGCIMFSPVVIIVALYSLMTTYGLLNRYISLILTNATFALPFCVWLATGYLQSVPHDLDEAAAIDGAGRLQTLALIVLPLALPGIVTVFIFSFIQAWNEFLLANTFMSTTEMKPLSVTLYSFIGYRGIEWQYIAGAVILATVPAVALFVAVQRWLLKGLTVGAVK
jgi:multiple sugar transport system permease protein